MDTIAYQTFIDQLTLNLQADPRVQGLVLAGSTANQSHAPDEWSDHDFFVITESGAQEHFRTSFDWLPDHESIVLTVRETQHGLKILYRSGHLLEYAVFDLEELQVAKANDYLITIDRSEIAAVMQAIAVPTTERSPYTEATRTRDLGMVLSLLLVGAGRVARGEAISGGVFIRTYAVGHLLPLLVDTLPADDISTLDNLDAYRRFEQVYPEAGAEINAALNGNPIDAAFGLLAVYETYLRDLTSYPAAAVATVRDFLARVQAAR